MKISKKQWLKSSVVFFIMAGLFSLPGAVSADNDADASIGSDRSGGQTQTEFTTPITGGTDQAYVDAGVKKNDGTYKFTKDTTIKDTKDYNKATVAIAKSNLAITIDASGHTLTMLSKGKGLIAGINTGIAKKADISIKADKLIVKAENNGGMNLKAYGIWGAGQTTLQMTGVTEISTVAAEESYGIYSGTESKLYFTGLKVDVNKNALHQAVIRMEGDAQTSVNVKDDQVGQSLVQLNGDVYTLKLTGVVKGNSIVNLALTTKDSVWNGLSSYEDKVIPDDDGDDTGDDDGDTGDYGAYDGMRSARTSQNLQMAGTLNLWLQNGATWNNQKYGEKYEEGFKGSRVAKLTGGTSVDTTGFIYQNDEKPLTIDNYKGYTTIFYNHKTDKPADVNTGYTMIGGDTKVTKAEAGSVITLLTGNEGLETSSDKAEDKNLVSGTLNALANKLWYMAHKTDTNLTGKVGIAEGLTTGSVSKTIIVGVNEYKVPEEGSLKNITFKKETGQGQYEYTPEKEKSPTPTEQIKTDFSTSITGGTDQEYVDAGVKKNDGTYKFTKDSRVTVTNQSGASFVDSGDNAASKIQADKSLTFNVTNSGNKTITGITASTKEVTTINAEKLNIHAKSTKGRIEGINVGGQGGMDKVHPYKLTINGDTDMNVQGIGYTLGLYATGNSDVVFNGSVTAMGTSENPWGIYSKNGEAGSSGCSLIYSGVNYSIKMGSKITIEKNIFAKLDANGLFGNGGHAKLTVNGGGYLEINKENKKGYWAMIAASSAVSMNVMLDNDDNPIKANENDLVLKGNISASSIAQNINETELYSRVNLGLATSKSEWTGVANNDYSVNGYKLGNKTFYGVINLVLQNGAKWNNEKWGKVSGLFTGSCISKLIGGIGAEQTGFIYQNDENPITIDNYKGYTTIFYNHKTDKPADVNTGYTMIGGDTKVTKAEAGSVITLLTENEGLKTNSQEVAEKNLVSGTLNALANKLWYMAHKTDTNLTGKVGIAEGLTTGSVSKTIIVGVNEYKVPEEGSLKNITFKKETGQGQYKYTPEKEKPPTPAQENLKEITKTTTLTKDMTIHATEIKGVDKTVTPMYSAETADRQNPMVVDMAGHQLTLESESTKKAVGIFVGNNKNIIVKNSDAMKKLSISAKTTDTVGANGIYLEGNARLTINGPVEINHVSTKGDSADGILFQGQKSEMTVNGDLKISDVAGLRERGNGVNAGGIVVTGQESKMKVTGQVDITGVKGSSLATNGDGTEISVGGGIILAAEDSNKEKNYHAVRVDSGTININTDGQTPGMVSTKIKGNMYVVGKHGKRVLEYSGGQLVDWEHSGVLNVALTTSDSYWTGAATYDSYTDDYGTGAGNTVHDVGQFNLWLQNGAVWTNESQSHETTTTTTAKAAKWNGAILNRLVGGSEPTKSGFIFQKENTLIDILSYKGNTTIFYDHKIDEKDSLGKGWKMIGGDTKVEKAETGSVITLLTGNEGLKTNSQEVADKNLVSGTLNALANKLWYMAHKTDTNLTGKVGIAEGLTSRSVSKTITVGSKTYNVPAEENLKVITWKDSGQGQYEYTPEQETPPEDFTTKTEFTESITGDKATDVIYEKAGILKEIGKYELNRDIKIKTDGKAGIYHLSNSAISGTENMLSVENMYKNGNGMAYGVSLSDGGKIDINLKKLNVSVDSTSNDANLTIGIASGTLGNSVKGNISITGNVDVKIHGNNVAVGVYAVENHSVTINGNLSMVGDTADTWGVDNTKFVSGMLGHYQTNGIYAGFNGGKIHVNGDVNMAVKGTGMQANKNSEIIVTGGGTVRIAKDMNADQYALEAEAGVVSFHYAKAGETLSEKDVTVEGNIGVLNKNSGLSPNEDNAATDIYLGLNTANSKWTGVAFNQFNKQGKDGGKIHLYLGNGATWNHEKVGMTHSDYKNSHIYELIGDDKGGVINQNDASDIIIDKMSGKYTVFMAHQNKGLTKDDYKVGNVYVKDADSGAEVTMITDTSGNIDMTKEEEVYQVLNTLAGKLFYQAGNTNLTGKVAIAEGLTTASAVKEMGNISFNKAKQGQGSVVRDSIKPKIPTPQPPTPPAPQPPTPPASEDKPAETLMMNGGKNAMALAATIWSSNNNDLQRRMGDIRLSQSKNGLWARYLGGKNVWNPNQTNIDQQYNNIQIGYDTKVNGWTVGGAFDYGTSNDKYFIKDIYKLADASGDGKEKQYTFALYGSRQFEDGQYVDIIFKGAKVNSQYALNYLGKQMKGDYNVNGVSISGEYGKRIANGNTYIEPSIEFTAGYLSDADYKASSTFKNRGIENANMTIHQDAFNTLRGRLGLAAGYQTEKSNAFVKLSLNKEFGGDIKATFRADGDTKNNPTTLSLKDTWLDVEVGGSYLMDKDTYLYANLTKSFSAILKTKWRLDAGIRLAF